MYDATAVLAALGGPGNISELEPCITRVRARVGSVELVNDEALKALGSKAVIHTGKEVQLVVGPEADKLVAELNDIIGKLTPAADAPVGHPEDAEIGFAIATEFE